MNKITLLTALMIIVVIQLKGQVTAGFDTTGYHPVYVQSENGQFKLNLGMYTQFRYNANWRFDTPDSVQTFSRGYNLARTRIFYEGGITSKFYYHLRLNINSASNAELFVAYLQWNIKNNMNLRIGRQFMALGREDWAYPQDLAAIEFSANDFTYAIWSSFGFQFHHRPSNYFRYWASVGNGAYGGRRSFPAPNSSDLTFIGRVEWNILGQNWGVWDDMLGRKGREKGLLVGLGIGHLKRRDDTTIDTDARNATQVNLDFSYTGDGFQFFIQGIWTGQNYDEKSILQDRSVPSFYSTFGYWLNDHLFGYVRFDYLSTGNRDDVSENYASPGIGASWYPFTWSNRIRFSLEYNFLGATVDNTVVEADGQLGLVGSTFGGQQSIRFQAQFGF